ncbi:MAG: YARHG domain-containing protein [Pedobacter sp.]|nr:MAG: YARHG domain-containing protein [Pedobacter sp.]
MLLLRNILIFISLFITITAFAQQKTAIKNCPCTSSSEISTWTPNVKNGFDINALTNNFNNSINGIYIAEDRDSLYQIKIIVDAKSYGTFVHYQHLSFSKARLINKQVTSCETLPNVHDGGWIGQNIFTPVRAVNKQFVASTFFVGESYFRVDKTHFFRLYKCDKETKFGIHDADRERFYRKVYWKPEGDYPEISLFGFIQKDVKKYSKQQMATMRNTVYARYNYAFKEGGNWYNYFNKKPAYRWNHFKDVNLFITSLEKENLKYLTLFESADYYDNQYKNDFLDFWNKLRETTKETNLEKLFPIINFPFSVNGEHDDMPILKINKQQFVKIWPLLLQQENYDMQDNGKLVSWYSKSVFSKADAFAEQMIHAKSNSMANLDFEKINGFWKLNGAYADNDLYPRIQKMIAVNK